MNHITNLDADLIKLETEVFPTIAEGNTILLLGAGASISNKKYLSQQIINLYSAKKRIELDTQDVTEFVDVLSSDPKFDREDFDSFVTDLLNKLEVSETHRQIAQLPWKEIITTNYDLLIERAFDLVKGTSKENLKVRPIRDQRGYDYTPARDEVKYVKLHGCILDRNLYPLKFSTKDFEETEKYYKRVMQSLTNLSPKIQFLSIGYSFNPSDGFAQKLLSQFNKYNPRRQWITCIDPYVHDQRLAYYSERKLRIIS